MRLARLHPWRGLAGLPRDVWILATATLVNRAGTMVLPFLVLYLTRGMGFSAGRAGLTLTLYGAGALAAAPLSGRLCDRYGPGPVMKGSLLVSGLLLLVFPWAQSWPAVVAATLALSVATEAFRPASLAIVSDLVPPQRRKPAFVLSRLAINLGMSIGPAVGGFLSEVSFRLLFWADGATTLLALGVLVAWPLGRRRSAAHPSPVAPVPLAGAPLASAPLACPPMTSGSTQLAAAEMEAPSRSRSGWADPSLLFFLLAIFPVAVVFFQHLAAMPLYVVRDLGLTARTYGLTFTLNTLMIVFLEVPLNASMAALPHRTTLALGSALCGIGFGALALAQGPMSLAATVVIWTFGEMILFPAMPAWVADAAPVSRRGEYMGLYTMTFGLAFLVGPWLGTVVLVRYGGAVLWGACLVLAMVSTVLLRRLGSVPQARASQEC